jgi:hypothetical protein
LIVFTLAVSIMRPAWLLASPTMIRLGYTDCATCHVSPQGGGLLTAYGKGIDAAQSLRVYEVQPDDTDLRNVLFDLRLVLGSQLTNSSAGGAASSTVRAQARGSLRFAERSRFNYSFGLENPALTTARPAATLGDRVNVVVTKAVWDYRLSGSIRLVTGRDEMPSGIGLPDPQAFIRTASDSGDTAYPTQLKAFIATHRLQITPYAFGPGGDEVPSMRQHGAGVVGGVDAWKQHAIVGMSMRKSIGTAFDRDSVGAFARLGFGRWGVLTEHDLTSRTSAGTPAASDASYLAGHTQLFFAAKEWLVTSAAFEDIVAPLQARRTNRLTLGVQTRLSDKMTVVVNARDVFTAAAGRQRSLSAQLALKSSIQ